MSGTAGAPLAIPVSTLEVSTVTVCTVPDELLIDLRAKLMVCLIHLKQIKCLASLTATLFRWA